MLKIAELVLAISCFASFTWAIKNFFVAPGGLKQGMQMVSICGAISMISHVVVIVFHDGNRTPLTAVGILLYLFSLILFWWAIKTNRRQPLSLAYCEDQPKHLVQSGPYRLIRHPFYTSYTLAWIAGVLATGEAFLLITCLIMFFLYDQAASAEEKKFTSSRLRHEYMAYQNKTGRFLPFL